MRSWIIAVPAAAVAATALAAHGLSAETRQLDSHEHGVGELNIAFEGGQVAMELEAPGADIVGFEHPAESAEDRAKIDAAIAVLAQPLKLFEMPAGAGCSVVEAKAALIGEDDEHHDDHGHSDGHGDDDHAGEKDHDEHAQEDDHAHDEHAHDDDHDEHAHEDDHADHAAEGESHSAFRAEYVLSCADPSQIDRIDFAYFDQFPNARELEVQLISDKGSKGFEIERDAPSLSLAGAI